MNDTTVRDALEKVSSFLSAHPEKGRTGVRTKVKISAESATQEQLRYLVAWADSHSPVACTLRQSPSYSLEVEVVEKLS